MCYMMVAKEVTGIGNPCVVNDDITVTVATPQKSQPL